MVKELNRYFFLLFLNLILRKTIEKSVFDRVIFYLLDDRNN